MAGTPLLATKLPNVVLLLEAHVYFRVLYLSFSIYLFILIWIYSGVLFSTPPPPSSSMRIVLNVMAKKKY